jgi:hypothetical protein
MTTEFSQNASGGHAPKKRFRLFRNAHAAAFFGAET